MSEHSVNHLPYYKEYLEQILRPRVLKLIDEVSAGLAAHAWKQLIERMAQDQHPGAAPDPDAIQQMRHMLEGALGLRVGVEMHAEFGHAAAPHPVDQVRRADQVEVIDRGGFPDNPLARAVNGVRRPGR